MARNLNYLEKQLKEGVNKRWLIENLIPMGEIVILYAQTNQYKTFLSLKIALEVATGSQELGATESGRVLLINTDTSMKDLLIRIKGLIKASYQNSEFSGNLDINDGFAHGANENKHPFDLTRKHYFYDPEGHVWENDRGEVTQTEEEIWEWDREGFWKGEDKLKLIVIDTLSQSIGNNSINDDGAIRTAIKNLKLMIDGANGKFSILVIAHASKKNPSKGIMGSSLQHNDFPTVLKVKKTKLGTSLVREKMKSEAEGTSIPFKMRSINVDGFETLYVDIGKELSDLENEIISLSKQGLPRDNIRDNTYKTHGQQYNTKKSFNVVFGRRWNSLLKQGFLDSGQQDNN